MTMSSTSDPAARIRQMKDLETIVSTLLGGKTHTEEILWKELGKYRGVTAPDISDHDFEAVARRLTTRLSIDVERGVVITSDDFVPWLEDKKRDIPWDHWLNYKQWMLSDSRPPKVVDRMDELTNSILELVGDPTIEGSWSRRGLVIGDVQSGKTSSYLGLFNKAVDAGFRLIIVLAGNTESLRQQTQERVDEGLIGRDSSLRVSRGSISSLAGERYIGIGKLNKDLTRAVGMTTVVRDFSKSSQEATNISVSSSAHDPYVFVVKKQIGRNKNGEPTGVLAALTKWLEKQPLNSGKLDIPLLLLDDESDYASVNTREEEDPTAINDAIRGILGLFSRSTYVAFTATPFANIFIDHDVTNDLFPKDFVYSLESPSNYIGSEATFGTPEVTNDTNVLSLTDAEEVFPLGHRSSHVINELPESMLEALRTFFLANAIRDLRGHEAPRSMLVNVSRFKFVQGQVFDLIENEVSTIRNALELHSQTFATGSPNHEIQALRETATRVFPAIEFAWEQVLEALPSAVTDIRVQLFNSDRERRLAEDVGSDRPQRLIAVGGDVLSRGLTLNGLMVSYFYRRTQASDTLLQMARWFGYRDGYHDLCRVWISELVANDYRFVASTVEELKLDLRLMLKQKLTPREFGLAVRKHPGALLVTAKNKMKSTETRGKSISLVGRRIETTKLSTESEVLDGNLRSFEQLVAKMQSSTASESLSKRGYGIWSGVDKSLVAEFLEEYRTHRTDEIFSQAAIGKFVRHTPLAKFGKWDVAIVNGDRAKSTPVDLPGFRFFPPERTVALGKNKEMQVSGKSSRLAGADDLKYIMDVDSVALATAEFKETFPNDSVLESALYKYLARPTMLIYPLRPVDSKDIEKIVKLDTESLVIAVKIAIPGDRLAVGDSAGDVEYVINSVAVDSWFVELTGSDNDDDDD
jgi:hypothetical protein